MTLTRRQAEEMVKRAVKGEKGFEKPRIRALEVSGDFITLDAVQGKAGPAEMYIRAKIDRHKRKIISMERRSY